MADDEFEASYLETDAVLHREKVTFRAAAMLVGSFAIVSAVFSAIGFAAAIGGDLEALVGGLFFMVVAGVLALASVVGSVLRTIITKREVVLHAGIRHMVRIPLVGVTGVGLTRYDAEARRRVIAEGRGAFAAIHPKKEIVRIEWVDASGKEHVAYVASEAPDVLANLVRRAGQAARSEAAVPHVRVASAEGSIDEVPDAVEADGSEPGDARSATRASRDPK